MRNYLFLGYCAQWKGQKKEERERERDAVLNEEGRNKEREKAGTVQVEE